MGSRGWDEGRGEEEWASWEVSWTEAGPEASKFGIPGRNGLSPKFEGGRKRGY